MNHLQVLKKKSRQAGASLRRALFVVLTLVAIITTQVLLSVANASGAYEMAELKGELKSLEQEASRMEQINDVYASPQFLAIQAEKLGMVPGTSPAFLKLSDGSVIGIPSAASPDGQMALQAPIPNILLDRLVESYGYPATESEKPKPEVMVAPAPVNTNIPQYLTNGLPAISTR